MEYPSQTLPPLHGRERSHSRSSASIKSGGSRRSHKSRSRSQRRHRRRDDDANSVTSYYSEMPRSGQHLTYSTGMAGRSLTPDYGHYAASPYYSGNGSSQTPMQYLVPAQYYQYPLPPHASGNYMSMGAGFQAGAPLPENTTPQYPPLAPNLGPSYMPPPVQPSPGISVDQGGSTVQSSFESQNMAMMHPQNGQNMTMMDSQNGHSGEHGGGLALGTDRSTFIRNFELNLDEFVERMVVPSYQKTIEAEVPSENASQCISIMKKLGAGNRHWRERTVSTLHKELLEQENVEALSEGAALTLMVEIIDNVRKDLNDSFLKSIVTYFKKTYTTKTAGGEEVMFAMAQRAKNADENDGVYIHLLQHMLGLNERIDEYDEYFAPVALELLHALQSALQLDRHSCSSILFAAPPSRSSSRYMSATFPVEHLIPIVSNLLSNCPIFAHSFLDSFCLKAEVPKRGWSRDGRVELQLAMQELASGGFKSIEEAFLQQTNPRVEVDQFLEKILQCWSGERERICQKLDVVDEKLFKSITSFHVDFQQTFETIAQQPIRTVIGREGVSEEQCLKIANSVTRKAEVKSEELCSILWFHRMLAERYRALFVNEVAKHHIELSETKSQRDETLDKMQSQKMHAINQAKGEAREAETKLDKLLIEVKELRALKTKQEGEIRRSHLRLSEAEQKLKVAHANAEDVGGCCTIS